MAFQSCAILFPLLWELAKDTPEGRVQYLDANWPRLMGAALAEKTAPYSFLEDTLVVTVSSVTWRKELEKMSAVLLRRINETCGKDCVRRVEFRVGRIASAKKKDAAKVDVPAEVVPSETLPVIEGLGDGIADEALREILAAAAAKNLILRSH